MIFKKALYAILVAIIVQTVNAPSGMAASDPKKCDQALTVENEDPSHEPNVLSELWRKAKNIFANNRDAKHKNVYAIELSGIGELNEHHLGISGTEEFLETYDDAVHLILLNEEFGRITSSNYKTFTIRSDLEEDEFKNKVILPLRQILGDWYTRSTAFDDTTQADRRAFKETDWHSWIEYNLRWGRGSNTVEAILNTHLRNWAKESGETLSIESWRDEVIRLRHETINAMDSSLYIWRTRLSEIRKWNKEKASDIEPAVTEAVGNLQHAQQLIRYYNLLKLADVLPAFTGNEVEDLKGIDAINHDNLEIWPWRLRRKWITQKALPFARHVFASDGVGMGVLAVWEMDQWVADGADLPALETLLQKTGKVIDLAHRVILDRLRVHITNSDNDVIMYKSGDDAIYFLPNLPPEVIRIIADDLESLHAHGDDRLLFSIGNLEMKLRFRFSPLIDAGPIVLDRTRSSQLESAIEQARRHVK